MRPTLAAVLAIAVMAVAVPAAAIDTPCGSNPAEVKVVRGPAGPRGPQGIPGPPGPQVDVPFWLIVLAASGAGLGLLGLGAAIGALGHHQGNNPVVINNVPVQPPHGQPPAAA